MAKQNLVAMYLEHLENKNSTEVVSQSMNAADVDIDIDQFLQETHVPNVAMGL
jgi:hypothetical protein